MLLALAGRKPQEGVRTGTAYAPVAAPVPPRVVVAPMPRTRGVPGQQRDLGDPAREVPRRMQLPPGAVITYAPAALRTVPDRRPQPGQQLDLGKWQPFWPGPPPVRLSGFLLALGGVRTLKPGDPVRIPGTSVPGQFIEWTSSTFPTQYLGLRVWHSGAVVELCMVAAADGATGMGDIPMIRKGGVTYAIYLVETADPNASAVRIAAELGTKSIRKKT